MRPLEGVLFVMVVVALAARWARPRNRQTTASLVGMLGILLVLHVAIDGPRWQMGVVYIMAVVAAVVFVGDLRRIAHAKAGESSRWRAVPSPLRRAVTGIVLLVAAAGAWLLPAWLLPRVFFPRPDGLYAVGRLEVFWTDSTREERHTPEPGDRRGVWVSFWYPAEAPNGRPLPYHPQGRQLAADIGRGQRLPGFVFWNLARARTHGTRAPRFSIRQGRAPLLLFSHGFEGTRVQNTFEFETLASHGYVIASIEHTYSAAGTVLPDGRHVASGGPDLLGSAEGRVQLLDEWVRDAAFVLDQLNALPVRDLSDTLAGHLQLDRVGYFGHSMGGIAAAELMVRDPRVKVGINMDGNPFGQSLERGVDRPFLVFTSKRLDPATVPERLLERQNITRDSLARMWQDVDRNIAALLQRGGTEFRLEGAAHQSLSDFPLWSPRLARRLGVAGSDDPRAVHAAVTALTLRFFDQYLLGRTRETSVELPSSVQVRTIRHEPR
jgi:pimeloyl-ACP methyl ester carboxylesterase